MANFYLREGLETAETGSEITLEGPEARHAVTVSRTRKGEGIVIGNGRGLSVRGRVLSADPQHVRVMAETVQFTAPASPRVTLVQALAKGGRDELAVQAATELGVDLVVPWSAERSVPRWQGVKAAKGRDRWASIVREATKQSMRPWLPEVLPLASTDDLVREAATARMVLLEPTAATTLDALHIDDRDLALVVGPEGGLSSGELSRLVEAGAQSVRLGASVLRTSTAGPAALAVLNTAAGRW